MYFKASVELKQETKNNSVKGVTFGLALKRVDTCRYI